MNSAFRALLMVCLLVGFSACSGRPSAPTTPAPPKQTEPAQQEGVLDTGPFVPAEECEAFCKRTYDVDWKNCKLMEFTSAEQAYKQCISGCRLGRVQISIRDCVLKAKTCEDLQKCTQGNATPTPTINQ